MAKFLKEKSKNFKQLNIPSLHIKYLSFKHSCNLIYQTKDKPNMVSFLSNGLCILTLTQRK